MAGLDSESRDLQRMMVVQATVTHGRASVVSHNSVPKDATVVVVVVAASTADGGLAASWWEQPGFWASAVF